MKDLTQAKVTIANATDKVQSFVPYAQSFLFKLQPQTAIQFPANSVQAIYYEKQACEQIAAQAIGANDVEIEAGTFDGTSFTKSEDYMYVGGRIIGEIPYETDEVLGLKEGNRICLHFVNPSITSKEDLPEGVICKTLNTKTEQGYNEYTKEAFEDDGSLIYVANMQNLKKWVMIDWGNGFVTYNIDCSSANYAKKGEEPSVDLIAFEKGQTISAIKIDTSKNTVEVSGETMSLDDYLAEIVDSTDAVELNYNNGENILSIEPDVGGPNYDIPTLAVEITVRQSDIYSILYASSPFGEAQQRIEKGWNQISSNYEITQLSGIVQVELNGNYTIDDSSHIGNGYEWFDCLNGKVFGAVEAGPTPPPQPTIYNIVDSGIENGYNSGDTIIQKNGTATITIQPNTGYVIPQTITQANIVNAIYNNDYENGTFTISNPVSDVTFANIVCEGKQSSSYLTFSSPSSFTIQTTSNQTSWDGTIEYSTDANNWVKWYGTEVTAGNEQSEYKIYFRGEDNSVISADLTKGIIAPWVISGTNVSCSGNIENLLDYKVVEEGSHPTVGMGCFYSMFKDCTSLTTAPELPIISLSLYCYISMFEGCTSLTTAPVLPATTLAEGCYNSMFQGCTSLTAAPVLPATTLAEYCYANMFKGCTSLTTAPSLPATTLVDNCYNSMFQGCTSLTAAPVLAATTLAEDCYANMFDGCTSLTTAPSLPATTLADNCYRGMFYGCGLLTTAPALPATTLVDNCYNSMFYECTSLTTVPSIAATTVAENCCEQMFYSCSALVNIPLSLPATTLADNCYKNMFQGCTSLTTATALPATILADSCYEGMFFGCTSLTTAPQLPATTLASRCYALMFYGCTSLYVSFGSTEQADKSWEIPSNGDITGSGSMVQNDMFRGCDGERNNHDDLDGNIGEHYTYYTQNTPVSVQA